MHCHVVIGLLLRYNFIRKSFTCPWSWIISSRLGLYFLSLSTFQSWLGTRRARFFCWNTRSSVCFDFNNPSDHPQNILGFQPRSSRYLLIFLKKYINNLFWPAEYMHKIGYIFYVCEYHCDWKCLRFFNT